MNKQFESIDTPALLLNLNQVEKNIDEMISLAQESGIAIRPHVKTHKSIKVAKRQIQAGAVGITVAKIGEAETIIQGGIKNVLIAYPLSSAQKLKRVEKLLNQADITLTVDSTEQATIINNYFSSQYKVDVWIKVNSGLNRIGVEPNDEVIELARHIQTLDALNLNGVFTHAGQSYAATSIDEIKHIAKEEVNAVVKSAELCEGEGISIKHRSVGSTPTFEHAIKLKGITEVRPGNAVFYDMVQVGLGVAKKEQCALKILTSVVSKKENRFVIDAGSKTLSLDKGAHGNESIKGHGFIEQYPDLIIERLSEEHGVIPLDKHIDVNLNDKLTIIPNHACPVVNLFDHYIVHRDGHIVEEWKVDARGKIR